LKITLQASLTAENVASSPLNHRYILNCI
jgi:hypothetical protein